MQLGLSLEITVPPTVDIPALLLLGRMYCPPGGNDSSREMLAPEDAVENIFAFRSPMGIQLLSELGVTWNAIRTGGVTEDVAPVNDSRQRLDNQPG